MDILSALIKDRPIKPVDYKNISIEKLFSRLDFIFRSRSKRESTVDELFDELEFLVQHNTHLVFIKKILSYELEISERHLLIFFCHTEINDKENVNIKKIQSYFSNSEESCFNRDDNLMKNQIHILQNLSLVENANANGFGIREGFTLTEKARKDGKRPDSVF
jgi:hypothetical protein